MGSKNGNDDNKKMKKKNNKKPYREDYNNQHKSNGNSKKIITDSRFASVHSDPRFQKVPKHKSKVAIDSRFNRIFTDKRFASSSAPLDKRGKPKKKSNSENSLRHYYRLEEEKEEEEIDNRPVAKIGGDESETESSGESDVCVSEDAVESDESETSGDTDDDEDEVVYEDDEPEAPEEKILEIEKETHRLAVVNMDWRYVKAVDLYMMLSSFLPKEGQINSVSVYPSDFGLQRMKEEELHGPVGLFDDENENNDDDEIDNEKLRAYEKSRLRYYYAVVECDSIATADYLYKACDGVEFERSSNVLDLRFIPDSMEFKHPPRDVAKEAPSNYEGLDFHTQVLQQSKVQLSWDEDEPERVKTLKRKFTADQLAELELKEFLASDEGESDDNDNHAEEAGECDKKNKKRDIYRALLQSGDGSDREDEEDGQDMEVTFNPGLEDMSNRILKRKDNEEETVWNATLRKMREKKKARKNRSKHNSDDDSSDTDQAAMEEPDDFFIEEPLVKSKKKSQGKGVKTDKQHEDVDREAEASRQELELLLADDNGAETGLKGYNLKPKKVKGKKGKKVKEILEEDKIPSVHYDDPRFSALFQSPLFALDPTDPQFKRSAAYARQLAVKQQNVEEEELGAGEHTKSPENVPNDREQVKSSNELQAKKDKYELSSLVKSVKMKSKQVQIHSVGKITKKK